MTKRRISDWYDYWGGQVYVSFSGGKDSTVLLHLARQVYSDIEAVFVNTGLEFPEIQQFVKTFENVTILRPEMRFDEVVKKYGYPVISKEVSECVALGKNALASGKITMAVKKLMGTVLRNDGEKSMFNLGKYKPLLYVDFKISSACCSVMKKNQHTLTRKEQAKCPLQRN